MQQRFIVPVVGLLVIGMVACNDGGNGASGLDNGPAAGETPGRDVPDISAAPLTAPYTDNGTVLNILPPGQDDNGGLEHASLPGGLPVDQLGPIVNQVSEQTGLVPALASEPHFNDQLPLYAELAHSDPGLTDDDLVPDYYKPETLRGPEDGPWESQKTVDNGSYRARIKRDDFGVPHIYGATREDAEFGAGYATAADRLFLVDVLRRAGRGELSRFLGPVDFSFDRDIAAKAPYREADRTAQIQRVAEKFGTTGEQVLDDVDAFVAGLNAYVHQVRDIQAVDVATTGLPIEYLALGVSLEDFTREDVHAIATLIQSIFAGGGGGEADNLRLLYALRDQTGDAASACRLWRDIRQAVDPASPVSTTKSYPTQSPRDYDDDICPLQPGFASAYPGNALFDPGSYQPYAALTTQRCGRPGQPLCPQPIVSGNLPQLPASAPVLDLLDELIGGLLGAVADNRDRAGAPLFAADRQSIRRSVPAPQLAAARARVAGIAQTFANLAHGVPHKISNALLVSGAHTASGNPIAVFGPQTSYFVPQLLLEMAVHGGDIDTRGITFAGLPYVVIGRGVDFAWSATSGSSDLTDVRALRTCSAAAPRAGSDPAPAGTPTGYLRNGRCKPFDFIREQWPARWNLAVPMDNPADVGQNFAVARNVIRTDEYGPVFAFATVQGQPVALTRQRSTYRAELDTVLPFYLATKNAVHDAESFQRAFNTTTGSFNWFYADRDDIAYIHSGLYPIRAPGVHPDLPTWGGGNYDWHGFLPLSRHPRDKNPARGFLDSWNNRPARDWWAADSNASYGPVHRVDMLQTRLEKLVAAGNVTRGNVVEAMADAATVDLRGEEVLPEALDLLEQGTLTDAEQQAVDLMRGWVDNETMRRDRDDDGQYDDQAAVALMDAWYDPMIEAVLPQLTPLEDVGGENRMIMERDNRPGPMGSAYQAGYYGYLRRVFDMALGRAQHPYRELRCAASDDAGICRDALRESLDSALAALGGIDNRDNWDADENADKIHHRALGLSAVRDIEWQNRPTFQQVVQFNARR